MNIPDEVLHDAYKVILRRSGDVDAYYQDGIEAAFQVIAEWARREALRDAEAEVRAIPCWGNGNESGFDVGPDPVRVVRDTMRRLAEETKP